MSKSKRRRQGNSRAAFVAGREDMQPTAEELEWLDRARKALAEREQDSGGWVGEGAGGNADVLSIFTGKPVSVWIDGKPLPEGSITDIRFVENESSGDS